MHIYMICIPIYIYICSTEDDSFCYLSALSQTIIWSLKIDSEQMCQNEITKYSIKWVRNESPKNKNHCDENKN